MVSNTVPWTPSWFSWLAIQLKMTWGIEQKPSADSVACLQWRSSTSFGDLIKCERGAKDIQQRQQTCSLVGIQSLVESAHSLARFRSKAPTADVVLVLQRLWNYDCSCKVWRCGWSTLKYTMCIVPSRSHCVDSHYTLVYNVHCSILLTRYIFPLHSDIQCASFHLAHTAWTAISLGRVSAASEAMFRSSPRFWQL